MKLEFKNVTKQYGEVNAVNKVNCVMEKGIYGLLGVNGAGKTKLSRTLTAQMLQAGQTKNSATTSRKKTFLVQTAVLTTSPTFVSSTLCSRLSKV